MRKNKLSFIALSITGILSTFYINASENIIIDNNKKRDLTVEIKNGIEHIKIEKADENGISHNYYQKFNVSKNGVVIQNPTYLTNLEAKFIINEVTSKKKSLLNGQLRLEGGSAYLMVANPNGIECNGCSFSGTKQQLLVTGRVKLVNNQESTTFPQGGTIQYRDGDLKINVSAAGKIIFKNNVKPVHNQGVLTLISDELAMLDGDVEGKYLKTIIGNNEIKISPKYNAPHRSYIRYNFSTKQKIPANYSLIRKGNKGKMDLYSVVAYPDYYHSATGYLGPQENSPYAGLVINEGAIVKFDALSITKTGDSQIINKGQLNVKRFYANVDNQIINEPGAKLIIGDDGNYEAKKLFDSEIKAKNLIFDSAYLNINKANITFELDLFGNYDGIININDSTINLNGNYFVNTDFIADRENKDKINGGKLYFKRSNFNIENNHIFYNSGLISGSGYVKIKSADVINSGTIEAKNYIQKIDGIDRLKNKGIIEIDALNVNNDNGNILSERNLEIDTVSLSSVDGTISTTHWKKKPLIKTANLALFDEMTLAGIKKAKFGQSNKLLENAFE